MWSRYRVRYDSDAINIWRKIDLFHRAINQRQHSITDLRQNCFAFARSESLHSFYPATVNELWSKKESKDFDDSSRILDTYHMIRISCSMYGGEETWRLWGKQKNRSVLPLVHRINPSRTIACHRATHLWGASPRSTHIRRHREKEYFPKQSHPRVHYRTRSTRKIAIRGRMFPRSKNGGREEKMTVSWQDPTDNTCDTKNSA